MDIGAEKKIRTLKRGEDCHQDQEGERKKGKRREGSSNKKAKGGRGGYGLPCLHHRGPIHVRWKGVRAEKTRKKRA